MSAEYNTLCTAAEMSDESLPATADTGSADGENPAAWESAWIDVGGEG